MIDIVDFCEKMSLRFGRREIFEWSESGGLKRIEKLSLGR